MIADDQGQPARPGDEPEQAVGAGRTERAREARLEARPSDTRRDHSPRSKSAADAADASLSATPRGRTRHASLRAARPSSTARRSSDARSRGG